MDDTTPGTEALRHSGTKGLDYQAAAERLLVALSSHAARHPDDPIPAVRICPLIFDLAVRARWKGGRESWRRRVRDAAAVARTILRQWHQPPNSSPEPQILPCLSADGRGYWMTGDPHIITWYAAQRRRHGLTALTAASRGKQTLTAQPSLFPSEYAHA